MTLRAGKGGKLFLAWEMCGRNEVEAAEQAMGCTVGIGHYPRSPSAAGGTR